MYREERLKKRTICEDKGYLIHAYTYTYIME